MCLTTGSLIRIRPGKPFYINDVERLSRPSAISDPKNDLNILTLRYRTAFHDFVRRYPAGRLDGFSSQHHFERMPFVFKKILDKGASHPVVARLQMQTHELLQSTCLKKDAREAIMQAAFDTSLRLIRCFDIADKLRTECASAEAGHEPGNNPQARNIPHIVGLEQDAETFLYEAKNFLRDATAIVNAAFGTKFGKASQFTKLGKKARISDWAEKTFGKTNRLTEFFHWHEGWTGDVVKMRNAVEHPGEKSGTFIIRNYELMPNGTICRPVWHFEGQPTNRLLEEMEGLCDYMLVFAEELIALITERNLASPILQLYELPMEKRNLEIPKRFVISLTPEAAERLKAKEQADRQNKPEAHQARDHPRE
jgi:hypothetical protein